MQVTAGSISRADAWHKLVEIVESKWGGPQAFLAHSGELYDSHRVGVDDRMHARCLHLNDNDRCIIAEHA